MDENGTPGGPGEHDHQTLVLFERLLAVAERRTGLRFTRIVELLHHLHQRDQRRERLISGLWTSLIGIVLGAAGLIAVLGLRAWMVGGHGG